jgi:hypothetical protein
MKGILVKKRVFEIVIPQDVCTLTLIGLEFSKDWNEVWQEVFESL